MEDEQPKNHPVRKTNNTNLCEIGEKVYADILMHDIVITRITPRYKKETHGHEGLSHSYTYEYHGKEYYIWPWEITRYNEEGQLMRWGPGYDKYGQYTKGEKQNDSM